MRTQHTLFIIGAGASKEAGFPVGTELVSDVAARLNFQICDGALQEYSGDRDILDVFQQYEQTRENINAYLEAARRVRDGVIYSKSIDVFIDTHRENKKIQFCGKLAIAKTILEAEKNSKLFIEKRIDEFTGLQDLEKTWFFNLARNLNAGIRKEHIGKIFENVSN